MEDLLFMISQMCQTMFAVVKDGVVYHLNGEEIPVEHIMYHKVPKDGYYEIWEATCDGQCEVGKASIETCRAYAPLKCAVYTFRAVNDCEFRLSLSDCETLINSKG